MSSPARPAVRPVWIGTSWKMTKTIGEARAYVDRLVAAPLPPGVQPFVLPAHTALAAVRDALPPGSPVLLGAQDAHWAADGAVTGAVSMRMVADAGARLVEVGHSERRSAFGETDRVVALKVRAATDHGLVPLVCVGEPREVRAAGREVAFVVAQLRAALQLLDAAEASLAVVAYEPVWAIGSTGRPAAPAEVAAVMAALSAELLELTAGAGARALLYGGGVDAGRAAALLEDPCTDGLFVGRAAWTAEGLLALLAVTAPRPPAPDHPAPDHPTRPADPRGDVR